MTGCPNCEALQGAIDSLVAGNVHDENTLREVLRFIAGPSDSGPLIGVYRDAGGGYEGLQAVARYGLGEP